jgi:hypothetical protein
MLRAAEFITEDHKGVIPGGHDNAMPGAHRMRDNGGYDRTNHMNRMMMAAAMHDGKSKKAIPRDQMDPASWVEKYNTAHPYTKEEDNMIHGAMKTIGAENHHVVSDHRSIETPDTHKVSPVKGFKGYGR